ncbi:hypothetical protein E1A91_D01G155500v1 [Gossypium mustelinum]|uniref:SCP domain-containing protein n=1 Tax=Gossypium mustelinum TaxID=34275 RepID=A0A5D2W7M1_GOSMU|nr:hypothetical protein E1A91_D01G155500v1 [Gossypium mustelinum]
MSTKTLTIFTFFSLYVVISSGVVPGQDSNPSNGKANAISRPPAMTSSSQTKQNVVPINRSGTSKFVADFLSTHNAWARKRVNDCGLIHSGGPYGENLFWGGSPTDWSPTTVVKIWAAEKAFYDPKSNSCAKNHMCGHYMQIVRKDTLRVSCLVSCASVKWNNIKGTYVICNYDPPASYLNKHPFGNFCNVLGRCRRRV